jgi:hypothetical protein
MFSQMKDAATISAAERQPGRQPSFLLRYAKEVLSSPDTAALALLGDIRMPMQRRSVSRTSAPLFRRMRKTFFASMEIANAGSLPPAVATAHAVDHRAGALRHRGVERRHSGIR